MNHKPLPNLGILEKFRYDPNTGHIYRKDLRGGRESKPETP